MLISSILFAVMVIMFGWIRLFHLQHGTPGGRLDEPDDSDFFRIFHDVGDADIDLQIPVRHSEYEL